MQLLKSCQNQLLDVSTERLLNSLQDIVSNVQIQPNFCISHPDYKPLELSSEVVARFQRLPPAIQSKYLSLQLRSFLYGIYYNGSLQAALALDTSSSGLALHQDLENNSFLGVDWVFYERLHKSNEGEGYFDPGWYVLRQESDGSLAVQKGGLTLHIERDRHLQSVAQSATVGDSVAIRMPRNLIQNGFYIAVSNVGPNTHDGTVRVYFNLSSQGATPVMESITKQLNRILIPFTFKVLYNPSDYGRYDSGVLYFEKSNYKQVQPVLQTVYMENQSHFQVDIPLFTKWLAPGLGLAEEPNCKFAVQESFGMNRSQIVANGLLEAWQNGDDSLEARMASIRKHFSLLRIEVKQPYLNPDSEDIYALLEL